MDVKVIPQQGLTHGRALNVPARPARPPRTFPGGFPRLGLLPEGEVGGRPLPVGGRAPLALRLFDRAVGQLAVVFVPGHVEIDVASGGVGKALLDQSLDEPDDAVDVVGRLWHFVDAIDAKGGQILEIVGRHLTGQIGHRDAPGGALGDQLVVNVGDVDDPGHLPAGVDKVPLDGVEDHRPDHMADVARLVDRRAAEVHPDPTRGDRLERLLGMAERVVDLDFGKGRCCLLGRRHRWLCLRHWWWFVGR